MVVVYINVDSSDAKKINNQSHFKNCILVFYVSKVNQKGLNISVKSIYFQLTVLNAARKHLGCTDMAGKVNIHVMILTSMFPLLVNINA